MKIATVKGSAPYTETARAGIARYACDRCAKCRRENPEGSEVFVSYRALYCANCVENVRSE